MKKTFLFSAAMCCISLSAMAQQFIPQGYHDDRTQGMHPAMTELYQPQPAKVTPGDIKTNSAPSDAIVLFDGSSLDAWTSGNGGAPGWKINKDGSMTVNKQAGDLVTKESFGDYQLHIEWCVPVGIHGEGQGRGNSGVYMQDKYELQVLDSYENETYVNGQAASIYKQAAPLVNPCRKPGEWNVYDIIYTAPDGEMLSQPLANSLSTLQNLMILCGHYKGVDERIRDHFITREISIGDYVLSGGELAAAVISDAVIRLIPGVLGDEQSALSDSFQDGLVAPPEYTRPPEFRGWKVPDILLSGNHAKIEQWRYEQALERTRQRRPNLLDKKD